MSFAPQRRQPEELIDLSVSQRCHVVGIGGPGMSPLAYLLSGQGHRMTGSDMHASDVTEYLQAEGINISIGHLPDLVHDVDVVTYSTAVPMSNVELQEAQKIGVPIRHRSGLLASLCAVRESVGVAGTHGKTTTTALLTHILVSAGLDPSCIVGGKVDSMPVGARHGDGDLLILECDESDGTLDVLPLSHLIITNIDVDHLDYFGSFEQVQQTFVDAAMRTTGTIVLNADDELSEPVRQKLSSELRVRTFGRTPGTEVQIMSVNHEESGITVQMKFGTDMCVCHSPLRGEHNAMNLAGACAMACALGVSPQDACDAAASFFGVERRFTERGEFNGALLVDDYAHLPAEIEAAIAAAQSHPRTTGKTFAVFQPNRFHRIAAMADTYADCFIAADVVVITDVYASGTAFIEGVTGELVVNAIRKAHPDAEVVWAPTRDNIVEFVAANIAPGDICISMGCGDIETFPDDLVGRQSS